MSDPTWTPIDVAVRIGAILDSNPIKLGTDSDVSVSFDGSNLIAKDISAQTFISIDPLLAVINLIFPAATSAETPEFLLYKENASNLSVLDDLGRIKFDAKNNSGTRKTFTQFRAEFGLSGVAGSEMGVGVISVISNGSLFDQMRFFGDTSSLGIDTVEFFSNFGVGASGKALLVRANQAAFKFDSSSFGGLVAPTVAGLFFAVTGNSGFEFRNLTPTTIARISVTDGQIQALSGTSSSSGFDVLTSGQMNLGAKLATSVKCWSDFNIGVVGKGLQIKEGTNASMGVSTLVAGTVTVSTTKVTASSRIFLTTRAVGGTAGFLTVGTITAATSFVINSSNGADTSTVSWLIVEPS